MTSFILPTHRRAVLAGAASAPLPAFIFDQSLGTMTEQMAKRTSPGPFTTAPIIQNEFSQGAPTGDLLTFSRGASNLGGGWWNNFDPFQGSIVFWVTPEWDSSDANDHHFFTPHGGGDFRVYRAGDSNLKFQIGGGQISVSAAAWNAGDTYCIVCSWDLNNTLDGTNYARVSVDDVHTYGVTASSPKTPGSTLWIGSNQNFGRTGSAIIEGFTIYRRILFDGTYGTDIGNGDEIAAIYNSGSGEDPTAITGGWGVVSAVPTDQTAGNLATGTGEAWSFPHSSNLLSTGRGYAITDYVSAGWTDQGVVEPTHLEQAETGDVVVGSDASIDDIMQADCTFEGWFRYTSGSGQRAMFAKWNASTIGFVLMTTLDNSISRIHWQYEDTGGAAESIQNSATGLKIDQWFHIAITFDFSAKLSTMYINGVSVGTNTATLDPALDAAETLYLGASSDANRSWIGGLGWIRFSDTIRYTDTFIPPARTTYPETDVNVIEQWNFDEGSGTTIAAQVNTPTNDGTSTGSASWNTVQDMDVDAPGHRTFNWGYTIGGYDNVILTENEFPILDESGSPLLEE